MSQIRTYHSGCTRTAVSVGIFSAPMVAVTTSAIIIIIIIIIDIHTRQGAIHEKEEREKEDSREAGSVDQWPAGLCPVANRGLKGSWTDHWPTHVQHRNRKCDIYN